MLIRFIKLAGQWFVHLPDYPGDPGDLAMVAGADVMLDLLDVDDCGDVTIEAYTSEEDFNKYRSDVLLPSYTIDFVNSTGEDGANYRLREYKHDLWLCNVTKYVFDGKFPATIYFSII